MTPTLSREMARFTGGSHSATSIRDLLRSIEIIAVGIAVLVGLGIWAASGWLASDWLRAEKMPIDMVAQAFAIMGAVTALRFVEGIYRSAIVGLQRQVLYNLVSSLLATLRGLGVIGILIWVSPTIEAFFLWQGVVSIFSLAILGITTYSCMLKGERSGRFSMDALRSVWRFAGGMMGVSLLALLLTQMDKVLLSKLVTLSEFGYYNFASVVASGLGMLISPITQSWYPLLCKLQSEKCEDELVNRYHQGSQLVSVILGSTAVLMIVFGDIILLLWTRDIALTNSTVSFLTPLALGGMFAGLMWMPYQIQLAHGWTSLAIKINLVAAVFIVPATIYFTLRYGAEGAAWVFVLLNAGYLFIGVHFMHRRLLKTEKWKWYIQDLLLPISSSFFVAIIINELIPTPSTPALQSILLIFSFVTMMLVATFAASKIRVQFILFISKIRFSKIN
jgi:O-antigen/teichoic acid export membrane protein